MIRGGRSRNNLLFSSPGHEVVFLWISPRQIKEKVIFRRYNIENDGRSVYSLTLDIAFDIVNIVDIL